MRLIRRKFLGLSGAAMALPLHANVALAQTTAPKLTQILRKDLEAQGHKVEETVVGVVDFGPGSATPWHTHPGSQELLHVIEGSLTVEFDGGGGIQLKTGEAGIVPAELVHRARNESSASAKVLAVYTRAAKDMPLIVVAKK